MLETRIKSFFEFGIFWIGKNAIGSEINFVLKFVEIGNIDRH